MADERVTEQGTHVDAALVRAFLRTALEHDAVRDAVNDLVFAHAVEGRYHPAVVASSLRPIIAEIVDAAEDEDWRVVSDELIAEARSTLAA
jgi:hypothetical protein